MTTTKTLKLTFMNAQNKKASLLIPDAAEDLNETEVRQAMDEIVQANVFKRKGVDLYTQTHSADYIERTVTPVFDDSGAE